MRKTLLLRVFCVLSHVFCLLLFTPLLSAQPNPVNCAQFLGGGGSSTSIVSGVFGTIASGCATAAAQVAGDHNTVFISYNASGGASVTTGCTDLAGNTYTLKKGTIFDGMVVDIAYADNIAAYSGNVVTCALSSTQGSRWLRVDESSGLALSGSFDNLVTMTTGGAATSLSGSITTATAGEQIAMFISAAGTTGAVTPGAGFTVGYITPSSGPGSGEATEYQIAGSAGAYAASISWVSSLNAAGLVVAFEAAANASNVRVLGATATQAAVSYTAPNSTACALAVSTNVSLTPLVNDLITDSTADLSRASTTAFGQARTVVIGKRTALLSTVNGFNTQRISGALQAMTPYYGSLTCGGAPTLFQFSTTNIPVGIGSSEPWPADPTAPGAWATPSSPGAISNEQFIDPQTGILVQRATYPGVGYSTGTQAMTTAYDQGQIPCDSAGPWVTPCNAAGSSGYASVSNSTSPIVVRPDTITTNWSDGLACETNSTCGGYIQQLQVNITGYCSDPSPANCQIAVAISENAGGSPASSIKTVTLPYTTPATVTVGTHSPGIAGIDPWVYDSAPKITLYDSYQYTGNVTTSGSTVTIVSGNNFDSTWTTGGSGRMRLSNVSAGDACSSTSATSHEETITGGFGQSVTLAAAPGSFTYYCAQDFSVMINRVIAQPSTSVYIQNVTVSYVSDDPGEWIDSGDPTIFAHNVINGGYLGEIPTGGGYAQLSWFSSTGYAQVIGPMQINAKLTGANTWSQQACPLMSPEIFIAIDDTQTTPTWYCKITDGAGKMAIVQVVYTGTCCTTSAAPNVFANSAAIGLGSPITTTDYAVTYSNATITDLTPSSLGLDLGTLITNYIGGPIDVPAAVPAPDCSGGPVQLGNLSVYCNLGQDYMGWMFAISPGNFNPVDAGTTGAHIIGSLNTWAASGASRFSGWHVVQDYGQNNAYFGYSPEPIGPNYVGPGATAVLVTSNTQVPFAGVSCAAWSNPLGITGNNCIEMVINPNVGSYEPYYWTSVLANGSTSAPYSETVSATGGTSPYTFALAAGTMPPSLLLNSSTGVISGTPSVAGTYTFSITATDSASHTGTQIFTINTGCCANPTFPTQQYSAGTLTVTATSALQGSTPGVPATAAPGDVVCISDSPTNCNSANLAQEYMMLLQKGVSGNNADWIFRRGEVTHILSSITSGTYTSCAGCSLANTGTCTLTMIGNGYDTGATAVATVPISIGAIAANAVLAFTNNGTGYASAPTSATISNGTGGVCSGTATVATTTTTPDTATKYLTFLPSSFSTQAGVPGWGGMYASYPTVYPSPIYGLNVLWNYSTDPNGVSTFIDQLSEGGHSFERPTQAVAASNQPYSPGASDYNVRYNAAGFVALLTTPIGIVSANPSFHGTAGAAQSNVYQAHPGMSGEDATPYSQQAAFDVRPLVGQATSAPGAGAYQPFTLVTGNIWVSTWTGASYTDVDDFGAVNRKIYATAANAGPHPLIDISGPGSNISTAALYTFCATRAAGECYAGSSVGQIYVNAPGIVYPWCYGNPTNGVSSPQVNDICVTNATPLGQAGVQFSTAGNDQLGSFQRVVTRVMNGATHETSGFANIHMLPDNSWALFQGNYNDGISRNDYMAQIPPFPPTNSIARSDFIPVPVTLNPPAGLAVNNAIVQFGYAEYGGNCTTRADACFANAVAIPNTNAPFLYSSETPAGLACSSGCTIMIPAISQRVLYYTVVYRNVSNGVIATLPTQVVVTP